MVSKDNGPGRAPVFPLKILRYSIKRISGRNRDIAAHGPDAPWQADADLEIEIRNRNDVVPASGVPSKGTSVAWSSDQGNGNITFFDDANAFLGSAQFPGEGPVGYRGQLKGC